MMLHWNNPNSLLPTANGLWANTHNSCFIICSWFIYSPGSSTVQSCQVSALLSNCDHNAVTVGINLLSRLTKAKHLRLYGCTQKQTLPMARTSWGACLLHLIQIVSMNVGLVGPSSFSLSWGSAYCLKLFLFAHILPGLTMISAVISEGVSAGIISSRSLSQ